MKVPRDARVAGFDDVKYAVLVSPTLTTIHQPCRDIAVIAFRTMMERLAEPTLPARSICLAPHLVVRILRSLSAPTKGDGVILESRSGSETSPHFQVLSLPTSFLGFDSIWYPNWASRHQRPNRRNRSRRRAPALSAPAAAKPQQAPAPSGSGSSWNELAASLGIEVPPEPAPVSKPAALPPAALPPTQSQVAPAQSISSGMESTPAQTASTAASRAAGQEGRPYDRGGRDSSRHGERAGEARRSSGGERSNRGGRDRGRSEAAAVIVADGAGTSDRRPAMRNIPRGSARNPFAGDRRPFRVCRRDRRIHRNRIVLFGTGRG